MLAEQIDVTNVEDIVGAYKVPARRLVELDDLVSGSENDEDLGSHCEGVSF